jgi:hypothetical protein
MLRTGLIVAAIAASTLGGCGSKSAAEVSKKDMVAVRESHAAARVGEPKQKVLDSFKSGNKVKLGASELGGATIEEWKVEAFHDEKNRKDLFVTFLYFRNDKFVDSSDTRIDFRNNAAILERWAGAAKP